MFVSRTFRRPVTNTAVGDTKQPLEASMASVFKMLGAEELVKGTARRAGCGDYVVQT